MRVPIIYINLAHRTDRRAFMEAQFAELGLVAHRLDAVTTDMVPRHLLDDHAGRPPLHRCSPAALACGLSHVAAWQLMLDQGSDSAIILEDDAILSPALIPFTRPGLTAEMQADIIKLETFRNPVVLGSRVTRLDGTELRALASSHLGTAGYLIGAAAARQSLQSPLLHKVPIDHFLFSMRGHHLLRSRILQASPAPVVQVHNQGTLTGVGYSDIKPDRGTPGRTRRRRNLIESFRARYLRARRLGLLLLRAPAALLHQPVVVPFAGDAPQR